MAISDEEIEKGLIALGANIAKYREVKFDNRNQFARAIPLDNKTLKMIEEGQSNPTYKTLLNMADALGITINELIPK